MTTRNRLYEFSSELPHDFSEKQSNDGKYDDLGVTVIYSMQPTIAPFEDVRPVIQSVVSPAYGELVCDLSDDDIIDLEEDAWKDQAMLASLVESARFGGESV